MLLLECFTRERIYMLSNRELINIEGGSLRGKIEFIIRFIHIQYLMFILFED